MNQQIFTLQAFPGENLPPNVQIVGNITRNQQQLEITYKLLGDLSEIAIATPTNQPSRKHELWQDTCFEFFVGLKNATSYWEFNLSPAGDWNIYRFDHYRQGMQTETTFIELPFHVEKSASFTLNLQLDLAKIIPPDQKIDVAITSVIKQQNNQITYWALAHKGTKPDFHLRDSFIIEL
ncbi:DOMON-like domain-containing protein [Nostoc sp. FACHB-110]|uniref:DOMON-like domain-containing protein n=1 Tax=Nostoc sp. FACHB-110 TaxID=2692834 RepID=UPI0016843DEC|nr:DOMON-like domain-containing protein [Nostoc sp. FACHB-110]MBD2439113.1 DOMON-like domain-containing protein [Nostoc sp. FACHB-110]